MKYFALFFALLSASAWAEQSINQDVVEQFNLQPNKSIHQIRSIDTYNLFDSKDAELYRAGSQYYFVIYNTQRRMNEFTRFTTSVNTLTASDVSFCDRNMRTVCRPVFPKFYKVSHEQKAAIEQLFEQHHSTDKTAQ